ncbi:MAG TPA: PfkB family carbohydrate kinase [Gemmataceae bacterium]|nr:PfkB family carbohydrate kinase [Gemmataceae bacterium]
MAQRKVKPIRAPLPTAAPAATVLEFPAVRSGSTPRLKPAPDAGPASVTLVAAIGNVAGDVCWRIAHGYGAKYVMVPEYRWGGYLRACSVQLRELGLRPRPISARGPDRAGETVTEHMKRAGLDVRWLRTVRAPTRVAHVLEHGEERTILIEKKPFARLQPALLDERPLRDCDVWCAGGTLDPMGPDDPVLNRLAALARSLDKRLCVNPSRINDLRGVDLSGAAVVQVSEDDRPALGFSLQAPAAEVADAFLRQGAAAVIVTAGPGPVRGFTADGRSAVVPAIPVGSAPDARRRRPGTRTFPTGPGDCVSAVHAWALLIERLDLYTALNYGVAAGHNWVTHGRPATADTIRALARSMPAERRFRNAA